MFAIPEQFSNATKANFESQFALFSSLTNKAFEGVEKFVDLNITAAKASLEESSVATKQLLAAKDPQEFFTLTAAQAQPAAEKAIAYGRHLASIASGNSAAFSRLDSSAFSSIQNSFVASHVSRVSAVRTMRALFRP